MSIKIIFHCGYGKAATTFMQEEIFSKMSSVLYLGKLKNGEMITQELNNSFYKLFPSIIKGNPETYLARNSTYLVEEFGSLLVDIINKNRKDIILMSNESIFDYGNYNAELNHYLLYKLKKYLTSRLNSSNIEFKIFLTIRNQIDILKSFYSYNYTTLQKRFNNFNDFIKYGIEHPNKIVFGGYHYDSVFKDLSDCFGEENIRIFIYEKMKEDINSYINEILQFISIEESPGAFNVTKVINPNSVNGDYTLRKVKRTTLGKILGNVYIIFNPFFQKIEGVGINKIIRKKLKQYFYRDSVKVKKLGIMEYDKKWAEYEILKLFKSSNNNLSKLLKIDLVKWGYIIEEDSKKKYSKSVLSKIN